MTDDAQIDRALAPYLDAARSEDRALPDGLTARILADAARAQSEHQEAVWQKARAMPRGSFWRQLLAVLGGAPALGGLVAACAAGIWLGVSPPQGLDPLALMTSDLTVYSATYLQETLLTEEGL